MKRANAWATTVTPCISWIFGNCVMPVGGDGHQTSQNQAGLLPGVGQETKKTSLSPTRKKLQQPRSCMVERLKAAHFRGLKCVCSFRPQTARDINSLNLKLKTSV
jgi:hypothetical protein